jgi:hypothetical protein
MRTRVLTVLALTLALSALVVPSALAGSPHFVGTPTVTRDGDTLTVTGKIAGLGNEDQVHVVLSADVQCVNPGNNEPQAENMGAVIAEGDFPVQSGKALFTLSGVGTTDPACSPPMTLRYSNVIVTDETSGISVAIPGVL